MVHHFFPSAVHHMHAHVDTDANSFNPYATVMGDISVPQPLPSSSQPHSVQNDRTSFKSQPTSQWLGNSALQEKLQNGTHHTSLESDSLYVVSGKYNQYSSSRSFSNGDRLSSRTSNPVANPVYDTTKTHSAFSQSVASGESNGSWPEHVLRSTNGSYQTVLPSHTTNDRISPERKKGVLSQNDSGLSGNPGARKNEHPAKSVSFASYVDGNHCSLNHTDKELGSAPLGRTAVGFQTTPGSLSKQKEVQSNVSTAKTNQSFYQRSVNQSEKAPTRKRNTKGYATTDVKPQSPPTKDTPSAIIEDRHLGHNVGSVQILSLYDGSILQGSSTKGHGLRQPQIQSNLNVGGALLKSNSTQHAGTRPCQSNVKLGSYGRLSSCSKDCGSVSELLSSSLSSCVSPLKDATRGMSPPSPAQQKEQPVENLWGDLRYGYTVVGLMHWCLEII